MTAATIEQSTADIIVAMEALEGKSVQVKVVGSEDLYSGKVKQASDKDGVRRFYVGRRIVSADEIARILPVEPAATPEPAEPAPEAPAAVTDQASHDVPGAPATTEAAEPAPKPPAEPAPTVTLTSGKVATGKTLTIRCAWVAPESRTKAQQKLYDTGFAGVEKGKSYEAMVKAAGNGQNKDAAMPDGAERVIKVQDAFQVRFSPENQKKHRNELRRRKASAKKAAREAATTK